MERLNETAVKIKWDSEELRITLPLPPVTKKNHGRIVRCGKRTFLLPSEQFERYQETAGWFLRPLNIQGRVNVCCKFYMDSHRIVDLPGLLQAIDDVLVHYKVLKDDNSRIVAGHDGSRVLYDKENPRTEITITELVE